MNDRTRAASPIDLDWALGIVAECQSLVLRIEAGDGCAAPLAAVRAFVARVTDSHNASEEHFLRSNLLELARRWALRAHDRSHDVGNTGCGFRTDTGMREAWTASDVRPTAAFVSWAELYFNGLQAVHLPPPVLRAADRLCRTAAEPLCIRRLGRAVGIHPVRLRRQFRAAFGMSLREYHVRARVHAAMPLLTDPNYTTRMVVDAVGYRSPKNFYRAVKTITRHTPIELRRMAPTEALSMARLPTPNLQAVRLKT